MKDALDMEAYVEQHHTLTLPCKTSFILSVASPAVPSFFVDQLWK